MGQKNIQTAGYNGAGTVDIALNAPSENLRIYCEQVSLGIQNIAYLSLPQKQ